MGRSPEIVKEAFTNFERRGQEVGLMVNEGKTRYMEMATRATNIQFRSMSNLNFRRSENLNIWAH
jgi:hypothetical protein